MVAFAASVPWSRIEHGYALIEDSRKTAVRWIRKNVSPGAVIVVPADLDMDAGSLRRAYEVVDGLPLTEISRVLDEQPGAYVVVPEIDLDRRRRSVHGDDFVAHLEEIFRGPGIVELAAFGRVPVILNYDPPVPWGDPKIRIVRTPSGRSP